MCSAWYSRPSRSACFQWLTKCESRHPASWRAHTKRKIWARRPLHARRRVSKPRKQQAHLQYRAVLHAHHAPAAVDHHLMASRASTALNEAPAAACSGLEPTRVPSRCQYDDAQRHSEAIRAACPVRCGHAYAAPAVAMCSHAQAARRPNVACACADVAAPD